MLRGPWYGKLRLPRTVVVTTMPIRFRYDPARDLLVHVGEGSVTLDDIRALRQERRDRGVPSTVGHTLTDFRRADLDFDVDELRRYEESMPADEYGGARHAEIVDDPNRKAILLLWRSWLPDGVRVEVFEDEDEAYRWLGVEPAAGDLEP